MNTNGEVWFSTEMLKLFVKQLLTNARGYPWSVQGLGMFRLYLSREVRLHVWDDRFVFPGASTIHTHPWHFESTVISGSITDRLYEEVPITHPLLGVVEKPTHMKQKIVCGPGGCAVGESTSTALRLLQEVTIKEGHSYGLTADAAHESRPEPGTITLISREFREDTEHAFVYYTYGGKWVSAEPRAATGDEIAMMAKLALSKLGV